MWVSERIMAVRESRLYCQKLSVIGSLSSLAMAVFLAGCASSGAFHQGNDLAEMGDWDAAVDFYRQAVQENPRDPEYRIALERAMRQASRGYAERARELEGQEELPAALAQYRRCLLYTSPSPRD